MSTASLAIYTVSGEEYTRHAPYHISSVCGFVGCAGGWASTYEHPCYLICAQAYWMGV
jgi:hypothetical protein